MWTNVDADVAGIIVIRQTLGCVAGRVRDVVRAHGARQQEGGDAVLRQGRQGGGEV